MAVPQGFKIAEPKSNAPKGFRVISTPEQSAGQMALGAADILGTGIASAAKEGIKGISAVGGLINPLSSPSEAVANAEGLEAALPDFQLGEQGQALVKTLTEKFKNSPEIVQEIFGAASSLGESIGDKTLDVTGSPLLAAGARILPDAVAAATGLRGGKGVVNAATDVIPDAGDVATTGKELAVDLFTTQSPTKQRIAEKLVNGQLDRDVAGFRLEAPTASQKLNQVDQSGLPIAKPRVIKDSLDNAALKQGFDKGVIASLKGAGPQDRAKMLKMVNIMERSKNNARFSAENRASDVLGDSLMARVKVIQKANFAAGRRIDKTADSLIGKKVDISAATNEFADTLDNLGVRLIRDDKGNMKPDFELSQLSPGDRGPLREVIRQMNIKSKGGFDGFSAHKMKRGIDNNVTFGKSKTGISGDAERALKSFRTGLDDALDATFPEYNRVNTAYSETIGALDSLQDVAGNKMNLSGANADKATGTLMRRVLSNAQSRITLLDSVNDIEKIAKKYERFRGELDPTRIEGPFKSTLDDDLLGQVLFVDELDSVFGTTARTSLSGQVEQAVKQGVGGVAIEAVAKTAEKLRGINDENAFKAIRNLLGEQK